MDRELNREAGFTPGPWRQGQEGNLRVYGPDGTGEHSGLIAVVYKGRANARLIAEAPSLYGALKMLVDNINEFGAVTDGVFVDQAISVLAKAREDHPHG